MQKVKTLKQVIEDSMRENENCRNSDKILTVRVYRKILLSKYGDSHLNYLRLMELPPAASIKRIRAMIQNDEGKYLPTEEKTAKLRRWNNEVWQEKVGLGMLFPVHHSSKMN